AFLLTLALIAVPVPRAVASSSQESMFEDTGDLLGNPLGTLQRLGRRGVQGVRVPIIWSRIAPRPNSSTAPRGFNAGDPAAYPAGNWAIWDQIVQAADAEGIALDFDGAG